MPTEASFCAVGAGLDCDAVALSPWSVLLGVPVPIWGMVGFGAMLWAAVWRREVLWPLAGAAALGSVGLLALELFAIGSICLLCEGIHALALAVAGLAFFDRDPVGLRRYLRRPRGWAWDAALPLIVVGATLLFVPPYWAHTSWQGGPPYPTGVDADGRPWIGANSPTLVLHEYVDYGCPHCAVATGMTRMHLGRHPDTLRIVRHHQPRMDCTPPRDDRCEFARVAVCAGEQDKFWEMDDWLFHHRVFADFELNRATEEVGVDEDALSACMDRDDVFERLQREVEEAHGHGIGGTPGYVIDSEKLSLADALARVSEL